MQAAGGAKVFGHGFCERRTGIEKWKHAAKKAFAPAGIQPPVKVGGGKAIGGQQELPLGIGPGAAERSVPMRAESLGGGQGNAAGARREIEPRTDVVDRQIEEWRAQRTRTVSRSPFYESQGRRLPGKTRALPAQVAANGSGEVRAEGNLPSEGGGSGQ